MMVRHLFFDIGGVLGTNGWDQDMRGAAMRTFGLDAADFAERHEAAVGPLEQGLMSLDEYLDSTIFYCPRAFSRAEFREFMFAQSKPFPDSIALARRLSERGHYRLMTLNNEAEELNVYRVRQFALDGIFTAFFSSCWIGALKPSRRIFELALAMAQANPTTSVFIDDRERNLEPARAMGMRGVLFNDVPHLEADLATLGVRP